MKDRVLLVDDDPIQCELLAVLVEQLGCVVTSTTSPSEALGLANEKDFDLVLTNLQMPEMSGAELCTRLHAVRRDMPVIVVTAIGELESAVAAIRAGAYDFLAKPVEPSLLGVALSRALEHGRLRAEVQRLRDSATEISVPDMIGAAPAMRKVFDLISRVASSDTTVLVQGETGTGKEMVARALHESSSRKAGPFVAINCASIPTALLESELFGHARGAFTDARSARDGLFVRAGGGTLFLDEIGDMPLEMQAKLLRALQERKVRPVGSDAEVPFDTRIVAATHLALEAEVAAKRFREDLYYRINVVRIDLPPLRERVEDILTLADHFLRSAAKRQDGRALELTPEVARLLLEYDWPGNVREMQNCMERATALARHDHVSAEDLPEPLRTFRPSAQPVPLVEEESPEEILALDEIERRYLTRAVRLLKGNRVRAAQLLGVDPRTLSRRLERYEREAKLQHVPRAPMQTEEPEPS